MRKFHQICLDQTLRPFSIRLISKKITDQDRRLIIVRVLPEMIIEFYAAEICLFKENFISEISENHLQENLSNDKYLVVIDDFPRSVNIFPRWTYLEIVWISSKIEREISIRDKTRKRKEQSIPILEIDSYPREIKSKKIQRLINKMRKMSYCTKRNTHKRWKRPR